MDTQTEQKQVVLKVSRFTFNTLITRYNELYNLLYFNKIITDLPSELNLFIYKAEYKSRKDFKQNFYLYTQNQLLDITELVNSKLFDNYNFPEIENIDNRINRVLADEVFGNNPIRVITLEDLKTKK